jgi:periplasmic divalent cation tolerance protein
MDDFILILSAVSSKEEARRIGSSLVDEKLAACVQIVAGLESIYVWKGKLCNEPEWLLLIKSRADLFDAAAARIRSLHSYDIPEIVAIHITRGSADYLGWMKASLSPSKEHP